MSGDFQSMVAALDGPADLMLEAKDKDLALFALRQRALEEHPGHKPASRPCSSAPDLSRRTRTPHGEACGPNVQGHSDLK